MLNIYQKAFSFLSLYVNNYSRVSFVHIYLLVLLIFYLSLVHSVLLDITHFSFTIPHGPGSRSLLLSRLIEDQTGHLS